MGGWALATHSHAIFEVLTPSDGWIMTNGLRVAVLDKTQLASGSVVEGEAYAFVGRGEVTVQVGEASFVLRQGMYLRTPKDTCYSSEHDDAVVAVVSFRRASGDLHIGGPFLGHHLLSYVDGARDCALIPPARKGDPCLNILQFPERVSQRWHTHPSVRVSWVVSGAGVLQTRQGAHVSTLELSAGVVFLLPPRVEHKFETYTQPLDVITWHPDSDYGPCDRDHAMLNQTLEDGHSLAGTPPLERNIR